MALNLEKQLRFVGEGGVNGIELTCGSTAHTTTIRYGRIDRHILAILINIQGEHRHPHNLRSSASVDILSPGKIPSLDILRG